MMKKILFGTTALAAVAFAGGAQAADDGLKLKIGGFYQGMAEFGDVDNDSGSTLGNFRSVTFDNQGEIWFIVSGEAANGLKYGFRTELEAVTSGDQIDEAFVWLEGGFGKVIFGADDDASNQLATQVPTADKAKMLKVEDTDYYPNGNVSNAIAKLDTLNHYSNDAYKLIYLTPRFAGFQFGVSYAPKACEDAGAQSCATDGGFESDVVGTGSQPGANDAFSGGVNYNNKFGDLGVLASLTYYRDDSDQGGATTDANREGIAGGAGITFKGLAVGVNYQHTEDWARAGSASFGLNDREYQSLAAGVQYAVGPWSFGANYGWADVDWGDESSTPGREDELQVVVVGGGYNLAPGLDLSAGVQYYDYETSGASATTNANGTAEVWQFLVGTALTF